MRLEAGAAGCAILDHAADDPPEDVAAALVALARDGDRVAAGGRRGPRGRRRARASMRLAAELDALYRSLTPKRRPRPRSADPLGGRDWILVDLHMHTGWSHDCSIDPRELIDHAEAIGLGGIAVTDHNVFGGAQEAVGDRAGPTADRDPR